MFTERIAILAAAGAGGALLSVAGALLVACWWVMAMLMFLGGVALFFLADRLLPHSVARYQRVLVEDLFDEEEVYVDPSGPFGWMRPAE